MTKKTLLGRGAVGAVLALMAGAAQAQETTTTWSGAPRFQNESLTFKVRGRVFLDYVHQSVDGGATGPIGVGDFDASNSRVRTARLGVEGTWNANWAYKAEVSLASGGGQNAQWEDLILEYKPDDFSSIMIGNFKTVGLENITSSRYITFMERGAFADVFDIGRVLNVAYRRNGQNWTAIAAVQGDSINDPDIGVGQETLGVNGRLTYAPIDAENTKLHLGVWARRRDSGDDSAFTYQTRNNTNFGARYTSSGGVGQTDTTIGLEGALVHKRVSLQAEWGNASVERRTGAPDGDVQAGYAFVSWFPTGESRRYEANKGEFNRVKILNPVTVGGIGAVELALRYDFADVEDLRAPGAAAGVMPQAGTYQAVTAGANWYPFPYARFMANYTMAENDAPVAAFDADVQTFQVRAQFDF